MVKTSKTFEPTIDAGLGLVYRLNLLWGRADNNALSGNLDAWNFVLDRIYCNLLYRNKMEVQFSDDDKEVLALRMDEDSAKIYKRFSDEIKDVKMKRKIALKRKDKFTFDKMSERHYTLLMMKDIWLRKYMQELGLYLKESNFDPSTALFGGGR